MSAGAATAGAATTQVQALPSVRRNSACQHRPLGGAGSAVAWQALLAACLLCLLCHAAGSPGDQSWAFQRCAAQCRRTGCASLGPAGAATAASQQCSPLCRQKSGSDSSDGDGSSASGSTALGQASPPPLALRLWRWDCPADCHYLCMWQVEGSRRAAGTAPAVQKYFGKWPFARLLGMQEPASVLFSLLNLAAHAHCLLRFRRLCRRHRQQQRQQQRGRDLSADGAAAAAAAAAAEGGADTPPAGAAVSPLLPATPASARRYPYAWMWAGYMLLSINAWLWSAVFHSRDTRLTERLDYISAALLIFYNLFLSIARVCRLRSAAAQAAVAAPLLLFLASHVRFMLFVLFDYGYHVKVCIAAGAAQSLLWLLWAATSAPPPPARRSLLTFILLVNACMALEVLDFPPLWHALDAHSLWHLATVPLVYLFYRFIESDLAAAVAGAKPKHA